MSGIIFVQNLLYPFFRSFSTYFIVKITAICGHEIVKYFTNAPYFASVPVDGGRCVPYNEEKAILPDKRKENPL